MAAPPRPRLPGEMIIGPSMALFLDEISTRLDISTTFQILSCLQQLAKVLQYTVVVSLLQPAPETYELFDDLILMAEGKIVYHGPRNNILSFFESCGFKCPRRKGEADFLQEVGLVATITGTVFLRTCMSIDRAHANYFLSSLFYSLLFLLVNGLPEMVMTLNRLPIFYKQRDCFFYPAWAYAIPAFVLRFPVSLVESIAWTSISYYLIGYAPEASRFFRQLLVLFLHHSTALSMFRCVASFCQTILIASIGGTLLFLVILVCEGFIIPRTSMSYWLKWIFWVSPMSYGEISLTGNEFLTPRWEKIMVSGVTLGKRVLMDRGLDFSSFFYWISVGALAAFIVLFNIGFSIGLTIRRCKNYVYPSTVSYFTEE